MQMLSGLVKRFFYPAIWWMDRLGYRAKFLVSGVVFCAAAGLLVHAVVTHLGDHIAFLEKERTGNQLTQQLSKFIQQVQQHRGRSASAIKGDSTTR